MDEKERRDRIVNYLRIKPVNHGQIYTFQIAIPPSENIDIPWERQEHLKMTLTQQGTNLMPLIVRRTEAYSDEEEYELVYGVDWYLVAKELDIEKLWVWVFNMTDEEVVTAKEEMQQLLEIGKAEPTQSVDKNSKQESEMIQFLNRELNKLSQQVAALSKNIDLISTSIKQIQETQKTQTLSDDVIETIRVTVKQIFEGNITKIIPPSPETTTIKPVVEKTKTQTRSKDTDPSDTNDKEYSKMTVSQLKSQVKERNIKVKPNSKKDDLIKALTNFDKNNLSE
jgi:hypothetical protein